VEKVSLSLDLLPLGIGAEVWASSQADGWRFPLGEFGGRVLAASDDRFTWLDADNGASASLSFAPDSGNRFHRALVDDASDVEMLGDPSGNLGQGLYEFAPDGSLAMRFHPEAAIFRWLTPGWSGALISYFDEVHWLYPASGYARMLP